MKTADKSQKTQSVTKKPSPKKAEEIKMDPPLSEKDEVKQAEKNLKESQKKNG